MFLDGATPHTAGRGDDDIRQGRDTTKKTEREGLTRIVLHYEARQRKGLMLKVSLRSGTPLISSHQTPSRQSVRSTVLISRYYRFKSSWNDMTCMTYLSFPRIFRSLDLFHQYHDISLEQVQLAVEFHAKKGQSYKVENLTWSGEVILNSCLVDLRTRIKPQVQQFLAEKVTVCRTLGYENTQEMKL